MHGVGKFAVAMLMGGLMACSTGPKGEQGTAGPRGATGPDGPRGPTGPRGPSARPPSTVWRDANGLFVGPVIAAQVALYFDARGLVWFVDPSNGQFVVESEDIDYDAPDCTGTAYVSATLPRLVFRVEGDSSDTFRTQSDRYTATKVQLKSTRSGGSCFNTNFENDVVLLADTLPATPIVQPVVTFVGPLRMAL